MGYCVYYDVPQYVFPNDSMYCFFDAIIDRPIILSKFKLNPTLLVTCRVPILLAIIADASAIWATTLERTRNIATSLKFNIYDTYLIIPLCYSSPDDNQSCNLFWIPNSSGRKSYLSNSFWIPNWSRQSGDSNVNHRRPDVTSIFRFMSVRDVFMKRRWDLDLKLLRNKIIHRYISEFLWQSISSYMCRINISWQSRR